MAADRTEEKGTLLFDLLDTNKSGTLVGEKNIEFKILALLQTCAVLFVCRTSMNLSYLSRRWQTISPILPQRKYKSILRKSTHWKRFLKQSSCNIAPNNHNLYVARTLAESVLSMIDTNKDGKVDKDEWEKMLKEWDRPNKEEILDLLIAQVRALHMRLHGDTSAKCL